MQVLSDGIDIDGNMIYSKDAATTEINEEMYCK